MRYSNPFIVFFYCFVFFLILGTSEFLYVPAGAQKSDPVIPPLVKSGEWNDESMLSSPDHLHKSKLPVKAKGIYVTGKSAGGANLQKLLKLVNETELNAMVIDVKEDEGRITYRSFVPQVTEHQSNTTRFIPDIDSLLQKLRDQHIYPIARIVCFKDPLLAAKKVNWAMQKKQGGLWRDKQGTLWIDPYRKEVWDYNIQIAKEVAQKGFKEIQFDYVRFPTNGRKVDQEVAFYQPNGRTKQQVIADFLAYARKELEGYPVYISADVFGLVPSVQNDMGIGQKWDLVSSQVDYISPMMYPSHYGNGTYGIKVPDAQPYKTIRAGLQEAILKNRTIKGKGTASKGINKGTNSKDRYSKDESGQNKQAIIRPWYQDFTARWVPGHILYGPQQVLDQIRAGKELGVDQYLIWDAANTYSEAAWRRK